MHRYTFNDGHQITSMLSADEVMKRMRRLDHLMVMLEDFDEGSVFNSIYKKAVAAYDKTDNFTGRIRLSFIEKDNLGYLLDRDINTPKDIEVLKYYLK